jgi:hypothetical protein
MTFGGRGEAPKASVVRNQVLETWHTVPDQSDYRIVVQNEAGLT